MAPLAEDGQKQAPFFHRDFQVGTTSAAFRQEMRVRQCIVNFCGEKSTKFFGGGDTL